MSLAELLPSVRALSRSDKLCLIQLLANDLAQEESHSPLVAGASYPVWTPLNAFEAAAVLLRALEEEKPAR
jgi:hypothetical protein